MIVQQLIIEIMTWAWRVFYWKQRTLGTNGWHYMYVYIQDVIKELEWDLSNSLMLCSSTAVHSDNNNNPSRFFSQLDKTYLILCKISSFPMNISCLLGSLLQKAIFQWSCGGVLKSIASTQGGKQSTKHVQIVGCGPLIVIEIIYEGLSYYPQLSYTLTVSLQPSNMTVMWPIIKQEWITQNLQHD